MYNDFLKKDIHKLNLLNIIIFIIVYILYIFIMIILLIIFWFFIIVNFYILCVKGTIKIKRYDSKFKTFFISNPQAMGIILLYKIYTRNVGKREIKIIVLNIYYILVFNASRFKINNCLIFTTNIENWLRSGWKINILEYIIENYFSNSLDYCLKNIPKETHKWSTLNNDK